MEQSVTYAGFMNIARFWVGDVECFICTMNVCLITQVTMECKDVIH